MCAKDFAQGLVEEVRGTMVGFAGTTLVGIYASHELGFGMLWKFLGNMHGEAVFALGVDDVDGLVLTDEHALIADLSTHLSIEGSAIENYLIVGLLLLHDLAVAKDVALVLGEIPTNELRLCNRIAGHGLPVVGFNLGSTACTFLLLLHLYVEASLVDGEAVFAADELGEVEGETVGVEEGEGLHTIYFCSAGGLRLVHDTVEKLDASLKGA